MTDEVTVGVPIRSFSRSGDPWFYMHAKHIALDRSTKETVELIPLEEYLSDMTVGDSGSETLSSSTSIYRSTDLLGNFSTIICLREHCILIFMQADFRTHMWCKISRYRIPPSEFIEYADKEFGIYPLWLCPLRQDTVQAFYPHNKTLNEDGSLKPMLNIGLWGLGPLNDIAFLKKNRGLEDMLRKLGGMKWLYANTYYTEKAFWEIYDGEWYGKLREKYQATSLPSVWQKVHTDAEKETKAIEASWWLWFLCFWPVGGLHGMHHVWKGKEEEVAKRRLADVVEVRT